MKQDVSQAISRTLSHNSFCVSLGRANFFLPPQDVTFPALFEAADWDCYIAEPLLNVRPLKSYF